MTQKKTKADIPADMWLHVATDALARWAAADGQIAAIDIVEDATGQPALLIILSDVTISDPRLAPAFVAGLTPVPPAPDPAT